jgi:hypothetical protein
MDETIEQISLTCANQLLATVLDGLDVVTLRNPSGRQHLELVINCIAPGFASISRIRDMLK